MNSQDTMCPRIPTSPIEMFPKEKCQNETSGKKFKRIAINFIKEFKKVKDILIEL